jgi:hypothetical protein
MENLAKCPLCLTEQDFEARLQGDRHMYHCRCAVCGNYSVEHDALDDKILDETSAKLNTARAVLSHQVRLATDARHPSPDLLEDWLIEFIRGKPRLPSVAQQATNIIRYVGDQVQLNGHELTDVPESFGAIVGSMNRDFALKIARQLIGRGLLTGEDAAHLQAAYELIDLDLTLAGWAAYESEQLGESSGKYGFLALKFGDAVLDPFVDNVIKPAVRAIGHELLDMRDVARAGIIDNLLRVQIRDAAFLLVDLTHDNPGAYWEAGYAEGLGKPVLYICEKSKFDSAKTHFDTNHCTTVLWQNEQPDQFSSELVATLRRSLNLFET